MTEGLFSAAALGSPAHAGYRLLHLEVFNWGTFHERIWRLTPGGKTGLLTGDIGSGKSTLVDALTTLLLPAHKISYNKAAGAETRERNLRSYVEGHYKSESIEATGRSRPVGLRDSSSYSVILGVFANEGHGEVVTLAQVFHQKDTSGQPDRFYVISPKELSIEADFTDFGSDLIALRRRLRAGGATLFNHGEFPKYARLYRRLLGVRSEQAMELFHQTVSMKSVGNLNDFVRNHMLEPVDASEKVRGIVSHFEDLTTAHDAVTRARQQLAALDPLVATADRYDEAHGRRASLERQRDAVRLFFAELRIRLLSEQIAASTTKRTESERAINEAEQVSDRLARDREGLIEERTRAGGNRVSELERIAATAREDSEARRARRVMFDDRVATAGLDPITGIDEFTALTKQVVTLRAGLQQRLAALREELAECHGERARLRTSGDEVRGELTSLAGRTSNLPSSQLDVRDQLCADLKLQHGDLPFAGELLDVLEDHSEWRGAAERVLRGFALSLLVPHQHYENVARWVNGRRLTYRRNDGRIAGSRLVYERVPTRRVPLQRGNELDVLRLADTIDIADGPFRDYLYNELTKRADYACVGSVDDLRRSERAVTREGQVRSRERHEKDDRSRIDDARTWVLGWVNERKIDALTQQLVELQESLLTLEGRRQELQAEDDGLSTRVTALDGLDAFTSWRELDWADALARAEAAEGERERLVAGSSALAEIERRLLENAEHSAKVGGQLSTLHGEIGVLTNQIEQAERDKQLDEGLVSGQSTDSLTDARTAYADIETRLGSDLPVTPADCAPTAAALTSDLQTGIDRIAREIGGYTQSMLQYMNEIRRSWPEATTEMDAAIEARDEFRAFHDRVARDDLPRYEADFKEQLNTNAIRELAQFNSWLKRQAEEIGLRVAKINDALGAIDYSPGRYITLVSEPTINQEVRDFRSDLRAATTDVLSPDDDQYSEQRFVDVKRIIERLQGRDNHTEADRAWVRRVTDVRNWFTFSASERDRATDTEFEHYRDSDGKSGGQKEKLAYTILAASLAYQFGLEWGAQKSRDFRFAVIDEAFGRGSDASTRYALKLFETLGLQLLIVTPLQKVHIIEPYVSAIGFVDNPEGNYSRLQTLTIEEFRERRAGGRS